MNEFQLEHIIFKTMIERVHMRNAQETVGKSRQSPGLEKNI